MAVDALAAPALKPHTLVLVITQSGETADTLAGLRESRRRGHKVLAVCPSYALERCDLALLLEQLDLHDEALFNWKTVLEFDPNNLKAREGVTRCRTRPARQAVR